MKAEDFIGEKVTYDKMGQYIWGHKGDVIQKIMDIRGWGAIQYLFSDSEDAEKFQDDLGEWIADAINKKLLTTKRG